MTFFLSWKANLKYSKFVFVMNVALLLLSRCISFEKRSGASIKAIFHPSVDFVRNRSRHNWLNVQQHSQICSAHNRLQSSKFSVPKKSTSYLAPNIGSLVRGGALFSSQVLDSEPKDSQSRKPVEKFRKDYKTPAYWIKNVSLTFVIEEGNTQVNALLQVQRNPEYSAPQPMELNGEELDLKSIEVNGKPLLSAQYSIQKQLLTIEAAALPDSFELMTTVGIVPESNFQLAGLYKSGGMFCTQCEAEGFRRITFFPDRPDIMATYRVRIEAPDSYPILLSNGNKMDEGCLGEGRHYAVWEDPFPKPSYLFAMVAGKLKSITDSFTTSSGRKVHLEIFSEPENVDKLDHAMVSLKQSMKWDEDVFGLEYDLDVFNIVAVNDFNMGAMENKGLNIFNTALLLARKDTATDDDYERIKGVVAHEYFHNWTGNRVTCRDWFQLTLKEGLTVFRDQQFSSDMGSAAVSRIEEAITVKTRQFTEDSGPMAHPIRPESYIAMDNFYTATVYIKGAEVIRMYQTLLGKEGFRKGMDLYFKRHDGQAVSCDDFRSAMADANGMDLSQFENWYLQAGTPTVTAQGTYNPAEKTFVLNLKQSTKATPGQPNKAPFHIPVTVGLLSKEGVELVPSKVLQLVTEEQSFTFEGVGSEPIASVLRDFSAPVVLKHELSDEDLAVLLAHDTDPYNQFEAGQKLYTKVLMSLIEKIRSGEGGSPSVPKILTDAFGSILSQRNRDYSIQAYALRLPDALSLQQQMEVVDPIAIVEARAELRKYFASVYKDQLKELYHELAPKGSFSITSKEMGRRRLRNVILGYLTSLKDEEGSSLAFTQFTEATCMTEKLAAFNCLADIPGDLWEKARQKFYDDAAGDALVLNKWFMVQANADVPDLLSRVKDLMQHSEFTLKNPNRLRSVVSVFAGNMKHFHAEDGSGYEFLADVILEVDKLNPQVSSRLAASLSLWKKYDLNRQTLMKSQLQRLIDNKDLSNDAFEIVSKSLL